MNARDLRTMPFDQLEKLALYTPSLSDEDRALVVAEYDKKVRTLEIVKQYELANIRDDRGYSKKIGGKR